MCRAIWGHDRGHTDSHTHTHSHTNKPPTAGVQLVGHTSIKLSMYLCSPDRGSLGVDPTSASAAVSLRHDAGEGRSNSGVGCPQGQISASVYSLPGFKF